MKEPTNRKTVGQIVTELANQPLETRSVVEMAQAGESAFLKSFFSCFEQAKSLYPHDFFMTIERKIDRILSTPGRPFGERIPIHRWSCPTPFYDQSAFHYSKKDDRFDHLWTIPDRYHCDYLVYNALFVHPSERALLDDVLKFRDGSLLKLAKKFNKEDANSILIAQ